MTESLRKSAFAKHAGISPSRVTQLIGRGLPVLADGRIDPEAGRKWLEENLDHARRNGWKASAPEPPVDNGPTLADARREREQVKAERERLALARERGDLVPRAEVTRFLEARGLFDRDAHLSWVARISARLSGEFGVDASKLHAWLEREMRAHLINMAETPIPEELSQPTKAAHIANGKQE